MPKTTSYSSIKNLLVVINFNEPVQVNNVQKFQPFIVDVRCDAVTTEGSVLPINSKVPVGNVVDTALTNKQIYNAINSTQTGGILAGAIKTAIQTALSEDVSA